MRNNKKVVCRPCKEENNWEIQGPNGEVFSKHYETKAECLKAARKYAEEFSCELQVENLTNNSNQTNSSKQTNTNQSNNRSRNRNNNN